MVRTRLLKLGLLALGAAIGCGHSATVASAADTKSAAGKLTLDRQHRHCDGGRRSQAC